MEGIESILSNVLICNKDSLNRTRRFMHSRITYIPPRSVLMNVTSANHR